MSFDILSLVLGGLLAILIFATYYLFKYIKSMKYLKRLYKWFWTDDFYDYSKLSFVLSIIALISAILALLSKLL